MQLVSPLVDWLYGHGHDAARLLTDSGIGFPPPSAATDMVPLAAYVRLWENAARAAADTHLGLHLGQFEDAGTLGALGYLFMSGASLLDAYEGFCAHLDALQEDTSNGLLISGDSVTFQYRINDTTIADRRNDAEYSLSAMLRMTSLYAGHAVQPREVWFEHRQAGRYSAYRDLFGCQVLFEQPVNALVFRREGFNLRNRHPSELLKPILASHLAALSGRHSDSRPMRERVLEQIDLHLADTGCSQRMVAAALGLSASTLLRRLRAEGQVFRKLLQERRMQHAERLLARNDTPIAAVALAVGYAENASFTRAFRQRHALSPEQYRRAQRQRPGVH